MVQMDLSLARERLIAYAMCGCSSGAVGQADSAFWLPSSSYQNRLLSTSEQDRFQDGKPSGGATDETSVELQRRCSGDRCLESVAGASCDSDERFAIDEAAIGCVYTG
jgi:hypothetical protein